MQFHALSRSLIAFSQSNGVTLIIRTDELNHSPALFIAYAGHRSSSSFNLPARPIVQIGNAISYTFANSHGRHDPILGQLPQRPRANRQPTRCFTGINENRHDLEAGFPVHHTSIPARRINS
jgi:hypothetical protein